MSEIPQNPPAFPRIYHEREIGIDTYHEQITGGGMTLRDYFAARAMKGFLKEKPLNQCKHWAMDIALQSFEVADAMLKARTNNG